MRVEKVAVVAVEEVSEHMEQGHRLQDSHWKETSRLSS